MNEEWDKLWKLKLKYSLLDQSDKWIEEVKAVGDKLRERVVYLEGLTDGDVKLITKLQVENGELKHTIATGYCGECDVLKEENKKLTKLNEMLIQDNGVYEQAILIHKAASEKLEAIQDIAESYRNHCIKAVDRILVVLDGPAQNTDYVQTNTTEERDINE